MDDNETYIESEFEYLASELGYETAAQVFELYKGRSVYFPKNYNLRQKHTEIKTAYKNGAAYADLARQYSYTESHIRFIIHGKAEDKQLSLF